MLLMIDNYDSFTFNLVQYFGELGQDIKVLRNDEVTVEEIAALKPSHLVLSPGPCSPAEAGVCVPAIQALIGKLPILGVCLGHQAIGLAFGGDVIRVEPVHGKKWAVEHGGEGVFAGLPSPVDAGRYHSLAVARDTMPSVLEVTAWSPDGLVMGVRHREFPIEGIQFHPESILTETGPRMLQTWLEGLPQTKNGGVVTT